MGKYKYVHLVILLSLLVTFLAQPPTGSAQRDGELLRLAIQKSLQQTTGRQGIADKEPKILSVAAARIVQVDDVGFTAYSVKILDTTTDTIYSY